MIPSNIKLGAAIVLPLLIGGSLGFLHAQWQDAEAKLEAANQSLTQLQESYKDKEELVEFLQGVAVAKDGIFKQQVEKQQELSARISALFGLMKNYEPKDNSDETQCLYLTPPADYLEWLQGRAAPADQD